MGKLGYNAILGGLFLLASVCFADPAAAPSSTTKKAVPELLTTLKQRISRLKYNWDPKLFDQPEWEVGGYSVDGFPLIYWKCGDPTQQKNAALILSSVHGDEVTPVYFGFKTVEWLKANPELCKDRLVIVAPLVNPDGFLRYSKGTRTNFNKVDINRNFDTPDWALRARKMWKERFSSMRRYYPGDTAASEPETVFQKWLIETYKPVKILSVHAPLNILDYDGPDDKETVNFMKTYIDSCETLKTAMKKATPKLRFFAYGNFPGSLGNYAVKQRGIPTLTAELPTIEASKANQYFSIMEKGTRVFIEYEIKDSPVHAAQVPDHEPSQPN